MDNSIGHRLRQARESLSMTQSAFSVKAGVASSYLSDMENGRRVVSDKFIRNLSVKMGISADWLHEGKGEMFNENSTLNSVHVKTNSDFDLGAFVDMITQVSESRKPTRYSTRLSKLDIEFEYDLSIEQLKDIFEDRRNLLDAIYQMGAPDRLKAKFKQDTRSFDAFLKDIELDSIDDEEDISQYENLKKNKLFLVENVYHPAIEHERMMLSKLIKYININAPFFKGGTANLKRESASEQVKTKKKQ